MISSIVIGGGLAGISIANQLRKRGESFLLLEAEDRLGGKVETQLTPEACLEFGPNSFIDKKPEIFQLIADLGLTPDLIAASQAAKKRYILKRGQVVQLPGIPLQFLSTAALSWRGKCRFLRELIQVSPPPATEESVTAFFTRHFGCEVADYFADPFVSGIYAGDPEKLSIDAAFPTMTAAERESHSLLRHMIRKKKDGGASMVSYQLRGGLQSIFQTAARHWSSAIRLGESVTAVEPLANGWRVTTRKTQYQCRNLYLTLPAFAAAQLLQPLDMPLSAALQKIEYPAVASVHVRVSKTEAYPFDGFGLLIPSVEKRSILGSLWNSTAFPALFADPDHHYLTIYMGGARGAALLAKDERQLSQMVQMELKDLFRLNQVPEVLHLKRHSRAIPQYNLGYGEIKTEILNRVAALPHLHLAGNYLGGISMPDTVAYAVTQTQKPTTKNDI